MTDSPHAPAAVPTIAAVIVAFHPDLERLAAVIDASVSQASFVALVDNGPGSLPEGLVRRCAYLPQKQNIGVAAAQNVGIRWALERGAEYVLLLDHDSVPESGMVDTLLAALRRPPARGLSAVAAGPSYRDEHSQRSSTFVRFAWTGFRRHRCTGSVSSEVLPVDFLISSGSLISRRGLDEVGLMDERLFVDHVDTEWCLRARSAGYQLLGVCAARMSHRLGDASISAGGRQLARRQPARHYYTFRNSVLLYRRDYPFLRWKIFDAVRLCLMLVAIALFMHPRLRGLQAAARGVTDGLRGRTGALATV